MVVLRTEMAFVPMDNVGKQVVNADPDTSHLSQKKKKNTI